MTHVPGEWARCGNTLFYAKLRHHDEIGGTYIDPADFIEVKWAETPEGFFLRRREVPENDDVASAELVRLQIMRLPSRNQRSFYTWLNFLDALKRRGSSPNEIVKAFTLGNPPFVRNEILDALEYGVFTTDLVWLEKRNLVGSREELDEALASLGVMECPI